MVAVGTYVGCVNTLGQSTNEADSSLFWAVPPDQVSMLANYEAS
jgi:hypothetical protein